MENTIIGVIGAAVGLVGLVMFIRALSFRLGGARTLGRIVSAREESRGRYVHKVEYQADGKSIVSEDTAGYSQPLSEGEELLLIYKKSAPEQFRTVREMRMNLLGFGLLAVMGVAFVVRFLIL